MKNDAEFEFGEKQVTAFVRLKSAQTSESVLKLYNPKHTEIHTHASKYGFGAALLQKDPSYSLFHPVQYKGRKKLT